MCIIFVAQQVHPKYPLIIASNRDEFFDRPTEPMKIWTDDSYVPTENDNIADSDSLEQHQHQDPVRRRSRRVSLAGRDLVGGGTWLGIALPNDRGKEDQENIISIDNNNPSLRWIAITNVREPEEHGRPSRGGPLKEYLDGDHPAASSFVSDLQTRGHEFNGFNLLVGDKSGIYYYGNRMKDTQSANKPLGNGIYGLSNGLLDSPWPKVERGKDLLRKLCQKHLEQEQRSSSIESFHEQLMDLLHDQVQPDSDDQLPNTYVDRTTERFLSSIFVPEGFFHGRGYGTRTSTTIVVDTDGKVSVLERTWASGKDRWFRFDSQVGSTDDVILEGRLIPHSRLCIL